MPLVVGIGFGLERTSERAQTLVGFDTNLITSFAFII